MPNIMGVLRQEIRRLARKESKEAVRELKRQVTALRKRLAATKKQMSAVERAAMRAGSSRAAAPRPEAAEGDGGQIRFSPRWVKVHRAKLKMSRRVYAKLVGVSPQTILLWESGKARPRRGALASWRELRGKGIRELKAAAGGETQGRRGRKPGAAAPKRRKAARVGRKARGRAATRTARPKRGRIARAARRAGGPVRGRRAKKK